jgi:spermidine synthase
MDIDNNAGTSITRFDGDLASMQFLRYDVTSLGAQLRAGGTAAIIGVGGGRDVMTAAVNGFHRIVGIEVNSAIVDLTSNRLESFSGFSKIPGFELHNDEGRSYLTRSGERFDLIQASLVDTWAATSAGAMTLSENALYTVDGWKVFYEHLKPGGIITFSRWFTDGWTNETYRLFSLAQAMLLSEGITQPEGHLALIKSGVVGTLLVSNQPFTERDITKLKHISSELVFTPIVMPGEETAVPELRNILSARTLKEMAALKNASDLDYSPTYDTSPYFFNAVHLRKLPLFIHRRNQDANLRAIGFVLAFMLAAIILVVTTIVVPARYLVKRTSDGPAAPTGGIVYFLAIGLGFVLVEMAMMQQLSIFLGHPIYSMSVVLGGLILSAGLGSLVSDRWPTNSSRQSRIPALAASVVAVLYSLVVVAVIHGFVSAVLWQRVLVCLVLVCSCGFCQGFCFPVGMRWMTALSQERNLPWMWALNGAAGTLGTFVAIILSMDTSIETCALTGATCYLLAGLVMPSKQIGRVRL